MPRSEVEKHMKWHFFRQEMFQTFFLGSFDRSHFSQILWSQKTILICFGKRSPPSSTGNSPPPQGSTFSQIFANPCVNPVRGSKRRSFGGWVSCKLTMVRVFWYFSVNVVLNFVFFCSFLACDAATHCSGNGITSDDFSPDGCDCICEIEYFTDPTKDAKCSERHGMITINQKVCFFT